VTIAHRGYRAACRGPVSIQVGNGEPWSTLVPSCRRLTAGSLLVVPLPRPVAPGWLVPHPATTISEAPLFLLGTGPGPVPAPAPTSLWDPPPAQPGPPQGLTRCHLQWPPSCGHRHLAPSSATSQPCDLAFTSLTVFLAG
jgi:hypothetical protein